MSSDLDKALSKARKLLALAARSPSVEEAATAAAQAGAILARHRLTMADLELSAEDDVALSDDPLWRGARTKGWIELLADGVARHYGCFAYAHPGEGGSVTIPIVGKPDDVRMTRLVFEHLAATVSGLMMGEKTARRRESFARGAVAAIVRSLRQAGREEARGRASAALVLAPRAERAEAWARAQAEFGPARVSRATDDAAARARGFAAGKGVHVGVELPSGARALPPRDGS